ncbi:MAG: pentapeptide repeat-containing protein [Gammaproteobacteria bacterium WSBS_2016_MAG_OTU1]
MTTDESHTQKNTRSFSFIPFLVWSIGIIIVLLILSIAAMLSAMISPSAECFFMSLMGVKIKPEILKFIGWGMSGIIAVLVAFGILLRAAVLDRQNAITEEGQKKEHVHELFKAATEHLGSERVSARIAAFYEFYRLAKVGAYMREPIFDILCAHLRQTTKHKDYKDEQIKPTEEVQSLLDVLFKPRNKDLIFGDLNANLKGVNLQRANLHKADLQNAKLQDADLGGANLQAGNLQHANLWNADLQGADLREANLQGANLQWTTLWTTKTNQKTIMPDGWENKVKKRKNGKTGVWVVGDDGNIIRLP